MKKEVNDKSYSEFAPTEREELDKILNQTKKISQSAFIKEVISEIPLMFFILNGHRQVVYSNHLFVKEIGYNTYEDLLSLRPGEVFYCINSNINPGGCGTSKFCQFCGIIKTYLESDKKDSLASGEAQLTTSRNGEEISNDYAVSSKPFMWENERFFIVTLNDISGQKRKEQLESVFFHDLLNKAGSVEGLLDILIQTDSSNDKLKSYVQRGMKELLSDIIFQRELIKAENRELVLNKTELNSIELIKNIKEDFLGIESVRNVTIEIDPLALNTRFYCDTILINRILTNLLRNAMEASKNGDSVTLKTRPIENGVEISVHNVSVIPQHVQMQLFQRSFSTKGAGRGLGTYSVKLFTEKFLGGKVYFKSNESIGTTFFVELPLK